MHQQDYLPTWFSHLQNKEFKNLHLITLESYNYKSIPADGKNDEKKISVQALDNRL